MGQLQGKSVAIKVVGRKHSAEAAIKDFSREATLWRQFHHPNVLQLFGVFLWAKGSDQNISLISPWMENGNLTQYLEKYPHADKMPFILDISLGLEYLHTFSPAVIHGDLKGTNILITGSRRACVADFGLGTLQDPIGSERLTSSAFKMGPILFLAPELLGSLAEDIHKDETGEPTVGPSDQRFQPCGKTLASDIYAFGCVCYQAYSGHPRFYRLSLFDAIISARENRPVQKPTGMMETVWSLVQSCWQVIPTKRLTIKVIISSLRQSDTRGVGSLPASYHINPTIAPNVTQPSHSVPMEGHVDPCKNGELTSSPLSMADTPLPQPNIGNSSGRAATAPQVPHNDLRVLEKDIVIALMGPSGSGKSSFINKLMGQSVAYVNDSVESCTQEVQAFVCLHPDGSERKIVLIDTPGFDDSGRTDYEILKIITEWLVKTYKQRIKLSGIIQLYSIADARMRGTPLRNLKMFEELCGSDGLVNVILTTTFWSQVTPDVGSQREEQLKSEFWAEMIRHGCKVARFDSWSYETAWKIIDLLNVAAPRRRALKLQIEIVDEKKNLSKTSAFGVLVQWWDHIAQKMRGMSIKEVIHAKKQRMALKGMRSPSEAFMNVVWRADR
ncbi:uncharacterized protein LACBIDRAFT_302511 [Laccaria bicolor S238N-H82]|uniref:Predicted protein n=1 Tax=Laccaria bicolor (strain S238N-H82 / ATCC MYA-4686) TaxID=486041 RepID=B0DHT7_LACBS|nr:uncharacterized protein LACBIDRAFT_302511 [Laccaria bicolor S238N-H82]EDR05787.1 predicted protein [Laccaria bicolor S238N-H82]|eukprot:XP_001883463.1 predicted protein [Laccaria bicolor S238N-H82]